MCLTVYRTSHPDYRHYPKEYAQETTGPLTADQDMICYKVVYYWKKDKGVFHAPYFNNFIYQLNQLYTCESFLKDASDLTYRHGNWIGAGYCLVEYGFHSFVTLNAAKYELSWWKEREKESHCYSGYEFCILKCVIPAGTRYYRGLYGALCTENENDSGSYCSEKISAVEVVK